MRRAKEYIDDLRLRLSRLDVKLEIDDSTLLTVLNAARRRTQTLTLSLYPERYGRVMTLDITTDLNLIPEDEVLNATHNDTINVYYAVLPPDFIDAQAVILRYNMDGTAWGVTYDNVTFSHEARRFDKRELYGIQEQSWNRPTYTAPVYGIERNIITVTGGAPAISGNNYYLLFAGLSDGNQTIMDISAFQHGRVEVWYTALVPDLELFPSGSPGTVSDLELAIPIEFEELTMLNAMVSCLQKVRNAEQLLIDARGELAEWEGLVSEMYSVGKLKESTLLPSKEEVP